MAQPTPEKILAIIDDHDRAQKKQRNKNLLIYLCLCLAIIGVVAYSFISKFRLDGVAVLTVLLGVSAIAFFYIMWNQEKARFLVVTAYCPYSIKPKITLQFDVKLLIACSPVQNSRVKMKSTYSVN
ncbi:TPA: hypothetical protein IFZ95_003762 [Escherichia coli]|nr:hypothetical protein [Escherichia coli]HAN6630520.1 hypothetical protein [Escherichia coli]HBU6099860.1 hypothetical protein [Escherichia coli]